MRKRGDSCKMNGIFQVKYSIIEINCYKNKALVIIIVVVLINTFYIKKPLEIKERIKIYDFYSKLASFINAFLAINLHLMHRILLNQFYLIYKNLPWPWEAKKILFKEKHAKFLISKWIDWIILEKKAKPLFWTKN